MISSLRSLNDRTITCVRYFSNRNSAARSSVFKNIAFASEAFARNFFTQLIVICSFAFLVCQFAARNDLKVEKSFRLTISLPFNCSAHTRSVLCEGIYVLFVFLRIVYDLDGGFSFSLDCVFLRISL